MRNFFILAVLALATLLLGGPALADEGRIELNQARALAGGVTPTDTPGFPITIDTPGQYVLTSNLTMTTGAGAIVVEADDVAIDLNGFELSGGQTCTGAGSSLSCSGGAFTGLSAFLVSRTVVRNGRISGFRSAGINIFGASSVEDVVLWWNGRGVRLGGVARRLVVRENNGRGIEMFSSNGVVEDCVVQSNASTGIDAGPDSQVRRNQSVDNGGDGIQCEECLIEGNVILENSGNAVTTIHFLPTTIDRSMIRGNYIRGNGGMGIAAGPGSFVYENSIKTNVGFALHNPSSDAADASTYKDNDVVGTLLDGAWVDGGGNVCNRSTTCP